ncbi:hypothetical protein SCYAM73S_05299 [Streptomyces cyaneofuscatus]
MTTADVDSERPNGRSGHGPADDFEVFRDDWGIPHLKAGSALALARAQGHNAALDRAWQLETERHRVLGTTAAYLGAEVVDWDRFARRARLADTARRCYDRLAPETAAWVSAYVAGVNAGLADGAARAPEFAAAGLAPGRWEPWTPLGVWLSTHILFAGFPTKLWREEVARRLGDDRATLFATDGPGTSGSNGWLLTGARTTTGAPVIAGDPHRFIEDPGVYQQIRLACPEFDVVGLAVPGVPGIAHFGHAGGVAWAITNAMADYQDLYREQLRRTADGDVEALGPDGWYAVHAHTETVEVAGGEPETVEVVETGRGPVIIGDVTGEVAGGEAPDAPVISLRYPPRVSGDLGFDVLPALLRARTVADLDTALDGWVEPVNVVLAADTTGATLHRVAGHVPVRPQANRLRVVPAHDPAYAWREGAEPTPRTEVEPVTGTAVMANERGLAAPLGIEFAPPHRARRIRELLGTPPGAGARGLTGPPWSSADMAAVHTDTRLASSRQLLSLLAWAPDLGPDAERLRDRLLLWDRHMDADSADATLYSRLRADVVHRLAAHPALRPVTGDADPWRSPAYPPLFRPWLAAVPRIGYALEALLTVGLLPYEDRLAIVAASAEAVAATQAETPPGARSTGSPRGRRCRARPPRRRGRGSRATTTACSPPPASPASPTSSRGAPPPGTSGTWPAARTACGWCRSARPAYRAPPTTATRANCGRAAGWPPSPRTGTCCTAPRRAPPPMPPPPSPPRPPRPPSRPCAPPSTSRRSRASASSKPTHVYKKSTGKKVATKTATDKHMTAKKLGSGKNSVDIRFVMHAANPFCKGLGGVKGAISGAATINMTKSGNWTIRSGKHRLMPNHHIYIYNGGKVTNVYTRKYVGLPCLIGSVLCQEADLTGRYGKF